MKVGELLKTLSQFNPELEVLCYTEDEDLVGSNEIFRIFEIEAVDDGKAKRIRDSEGRATLQFGLGEGFERFVFLNITADF